MVNTDGTEMRKLFPPPESPTNPIGERFVGGPAWSPASREIVFLSIDDQQLHLSAVHVENSAVRTVTSVDWPAQFAAPDANRKWLSSVELSPDGERILFTIGYRTGLGFIYVVGSDGTNPRHVGEGTYASWSPDGSRIAVFNHLPSDSRTPFVLIYTLAADGTDYQALVKWGR